MKIKKVFVPLDSKKPNIIIFECGSLIEVEAVINTNLQQGLRLVKMERLRDSFFQSFILYFANSAAVAMGVFDYGIDLSEVGEYAKEQPEITEQQQGGGSL